MPRTFDHIAISGSRKTPSKAQAEELAHQLSIRTTGHSTLHHGNAVGVDSMAQRHVELMGNWAAIEVYPARIKKWQVPVPTHSKVTIVHPDGEYQARNAHLVGAADLLIACPENYPDPGRSGTWHAIRTATEMGKLVIIIDRQGDLHYRSPQVAPSTEAPSAQSPIRNDHELYAWYASMDAMYEQLGETDDPDEILWLKYRITRLTAEATAYENAN